MIKGLKALSRITDIAFNLSEYSEKSDELLKQIDADYEIVIEALGFESAEVANMELHIALLCDTHDHKLVEVTDHNGEQQGFDAIILPDNRILDINAEEWDGCLLMSDDGRWNQNWGAFTLPYMTTCIIAEQAEKLQEVKEAGYLTIDSPFVEVINSE